VLDSGNFAADGVERLSMLVASGEFHFHMKTAVAYSGHGIADADNLGEWAGFG